MANEWLNWQVLEQSIPLDELPDFHRAFLQHNRPDEQDWDATFLRQIQGKVQATLKQLERKNLARFEDDVLFLSATTIPDTYKNLGA